jgi:hypothetical protein
LLTFRLDVAPKFVRLCTTSRASSGNNDFFLNLTPFVEWIWHLGPRLWYDQETPRILSAEEALGLLAKTAKGFARS